MIAWITDRARLLYLGWLLASNEKYRRALEREGFGGCERLALLDAEIGAIRCEAYAIGNRLRPVNH